MTNQTKTPGAMVLVPREELEIVTAFSGGFHPMEVARAKLRKIIFTPTDQPSAVGGEPEVMRFDIEPMNQDQWGMNKHSDGEYCRYDESVAPLLAELGIQKKIKEDNFNLVLKQLDEIGALKTRIAELEAAQDKACATIRVETLEGKVCATVARFDLRQLPVGSLLNVFRQAPPVTAKVDESAEFESWRKEQIASLVRMGYPDAAKAFGDLGSVQWAGWQARANLNGGA